MTDVKRDKFQDITLILGKSSVETDCQEGEAVNSVSESRRKFTKAGLLAPPVLMSVASQPVFGVQCLSERMSGNTSLVGVRDSCVLGAGGPITWLQNINLWPAAAGITVDTHKDGIPLAQLTCQQCNDGENRWANCSGGTPFNAKFPAGSPYVETTDKSIARVLCNYNERSGQGLSSTDIDLRLRADFIAAGLNAYQDPRYVFKPHQVGEIWRGDFIEQYPTKEAVRDLLESTW